jgi:5S rRNA maturation endonuclease (ribonuclease M5)
MENFVDLESEKILIVEGKDDKTFIEYCFKNFYDENIYKNCKIKESNGFNNIEINIENYLKRNFNEDGNKIKTIAVIVDADADFSKRCNQIKKIFSKNDIAPGTFFQLDNGMSGGFFCFPDNRNKGNLETLILNTCAQEEYKKLATDFINKAQQEHAKEYKLDDYLFKKYDKRIMQAYLAGKEKKKSQDTILCNGVGFALHENFFTLDKDIFINKLPDLSIFLNEFIKN